MGTAGNDGRGPHYFGDGETAEAVPRPVHAAWICPSCGQTQVGNVDQGCQNQECTVWKLTHEPLPQAPTQGKLAESSLESVPVTGPIYNRDVYDVIEHADLWKDGKWTDAQGRVWDRQEARIAIGLEQPPPALEDDLLPVLLITIEAHDVKVGQTYTHILGEAQTRTIIVALQTFAENVLVAGTPEGLISQAEAETLARALQP